MKKILAILSFKWRLWQLHLIAGVKFVSLLLLGAYEFVLIAAPLVWNRLFQFSARLGNLIWTWLQGLYPAIVFIRHEWFAFIALASYAFSDLFKAIWRITPQRSKPYLLPILPYLAIIKRAWLWFNWATLKLIRVVLKDLYSLHNWFVDFSGQKLAEYSLDSASLQAQQEKLKPEFNKDKLSIKAQRQLLRLSVFVKDEWRIFVSEYNNIVERLQQLRRPSKQDEVALLSPYAKEKRDVLATSIVMNILALAFPLFMLQLYDRILPHQSMDTLLMFAFFVAIAILGEAIIRTVRSSLTSWISSRFEHNAMVALTERFLAEPINLFERKGTGAILEDYKSISTLKFHYSGQSFQQLMDLPFTVVYVFIVALISPWVGLLLAVGYIVFVLMTWQQGREAPILSQQQKEGDLRRSNFLNEILKNIHTLKSMTMEALMLRRYERLQETCAKLMSRMSYFSEMSAGVGNVFSPLMTILVTALGAYLVINGRMTNGELAAVILLGMRALAPLQRLGSIWTKFQQDIILRDKLSGLLKKPGLPPSAILDEDEELDGKSNSQAPTDLILEAGKIELSEILYSYPDARSPLFTNVSMTIEPGDFVVISGESGSGRSTLLQIMAGILTPDSGSVTLHHKEFTTNNPIELTNRIAYMPQKAVLFDGSLLDNISVFDADRVPGAIKIAKELGLADFVAKLPRGWDTAVGDMAADTLSPGIRQRIAIVRALSSNPNAILFDNASSAIDTEGDALLLRLIEEVRGKVTFVMVSHRPVFQRFADRTVYLQNGKLIEVLPGGLAKSDINTFSTNFSASFANSGIPSMSTIDAEVREVKIEPERKFVVLPSQYQPVAADEFFKPSLMQDATDEERWAHMNSMVGGNFREPTDFANCLVLLLKLMYCRDSAREVAESLPYYTENLDLSGLQNALAQLGYAATAVPCQLGDLDPRSLPCLFTPDDGSAAVIVMGRLGKGVRLGCDVTSEPYYENNLGLRGTAYFYKKTDKLPMKGKSWSINALWRFSPLVTQAGLSAMLLGLVTISGSLFTMAVYSTVIPSGSNLTLWYLALGCVIATIGSYFIIGHRARVLAFISGRIEYLFGTVILQHLLAMPPSYTERASVGSQISRLQSFEGIRDLFNGPLASIILESPSNIILLIGLSFINPIALVVFIFMVSVYALMYWIFSNEASKRSVIVGRSSNRRSEFLNEMVGKMRQVRECGGQYLWLERFKEISAEASMAGYKAEQISSMLVGISYFAMMISAILIICLTASGVFAMTISAGALLASMMLMWRILSPIQTLFVSMNRIERVRSAIRQIDVLMSIQGERTDVSSPPVARGLLGQIEFGRVSFRYSANADPALTGVEFRINPGQLVAITGANGGGKSTVLKLLLGLYQPQAGNILIDNIDIRQLDPYELRRSIGYAPQDLHFFRASIAQNLRLARPDATDNEVYQALDMAGALQQVLALPRGLDFRLGDNTDEIPSGLKQKLILARTYITRAPIMLFDEPGAGLDDEGDAKFIEALNILKGKTTVIFISHRPSHIMLADTLMVFDKGYLRAAAPPGDLLRKPAAA